MIKKSETKIGRPPADWLLSLKNGVYTVEELESISQKSKSAIKMMMGKYAKDIKMQRNSKNRAYAKYIWNHNYFIKVFYNN